MKKILFGVFALVMAMGLAMVASAGTQTVMAPGQGGGQPLKDGTDLNRIEQMIERPIKWLIPVAFSAVSGTSATGITLTGASSSYVGSYYFQVHVESSVRCTFLNTTYVAANNDASVPKGLVIGSTAPASMDYRLAGPLKPSTFVHLRGLTGPATVSYQIGYTE